MSKLKNILGKILSIFSWKKSDERIAPYDNYIMFYCDGDDLKVEFSYEDIKKFSSICYLVLSGKVKKDCIDTIISTLLNSNLTHDANIFKSESSPTIKPSQYV